MMWLGEDCLRTLEDSDSPRRFRTHPKCAAKGISMKTSKSKPRQLNRADQGEKSVKTAPLKEITKSEIDTWVNRLTALKLDSTGQQLVRVYDAAKEKDVDALKEVNRKNKGMIGRMAKLALAAIPLDQMYTAEHAIGYALERLFYFSGEYRLGWILYLHRLRKAFEESEGGK
jgi:hypothetical protein